MSNKAALNTLIATLQEKYKGTIKYYTPDELVAAFHVRRPTGVLSLDVALNGGLPGGCLVQVHGKDGVGKDALINYVMAENQAIYGEESAIFWASFGYPADLPFMRMCGMSVHYSDQELKLMGLNPATATAEERGPQTGTLLFPMLDYSQAALEAPAENIMDAIIDLVSSGLFQIGIINEIGSGETKDNVHKKLTEDPRIAAWARLMSAFCSRFYTVIKTPLSNGEPNLTTVIVVNPVRANMDTYSAKFNPFVQTSGNALAHAKVIDIHLKPLKKIREKDEEIGKEVGWRIDKGKHGVAEGDSGIYNWIKMQGIDLVLDMCTVAKEVDVMQSRGAYYSIDGIEGNNKGGFDGFVSRVREDEKLRQHVRERVMAKLTGG